WRNVPASKLQVKVERAAVEITINQRFDCPGFLLIITRMGFADEDKFIVLHLVLCGYRLRGIQSLSNKKGGRLGHLGRLGWLISRASRRGHSSFGPCEEVKRISQSVPGDYKPPLYRGASARSLLL